MEIIKDSFFYKTILSIITRVNATILNSGIYTLLTKELNKKGRTGVIENLLYKIISFFRKIFFKLKFDRIFKDSIFAKPCIWVGLTVALAPFLTTMQCLALVFVSIISFFLKIMLCEDFKFRYTPLNAFVIAFAIIFLLSSFISLKVVSSLEVSLLVLAFIAFYFVIINSINTKKSLKTMISIFCIVGFIISCYGIYQFLFVDAFSSSSFVDKEMFEDIKARVSGTFDNPNVMGEYLLFVIPLTLSFIFIEKKWIVKIIAFGMFIISIISLLLTYSRGCYLGVGASIGAFLLLISIKFIAVFISALIVLPFILPKSIMNRFSSIGNTNDSSTSYRVSIWKGAVDMVKDYWYKPLGHGTEAFNQIYPLYSLSGVGAEHSHNLFLQIIIENGVLGIVAFLGIIYKFYRILCSSLKNVKDKMISFYLIAFISGMTGFIIQSLFDNTWYNYRVVLIFWIFMGLSVATTFLSNEE